MALYACGVLPFHDRFARESMDKMCMLRALCRRVDSRMIETDIDPNDRR